MSYAPLDLNGRVAVVTGGTSGIGRAIAHGLAEAGADVIATSRRKEMVETASREIEERGRRTLRLVTDVSDRNSVQQLFDATLEAFGKVDILVNSAGKTRRSPTLEVSESDWEDIFETNLNGTLRTCQIFGRHMLDRRYGRIINIASLAAFIGAFEVAAYTASKSGVAGLTRALGIEWAPHGVCVNGIAPGVFRTPMNEKLLDGTPRGQEYLWRIPIKRFGKVEELAGAAVFLASDAASYMAGEIIRVDGGMLASGVNQ